MKKIITFLSIAMVSAALILSSCGDEETKKSNTDYLTAKAWFNTKVEASYQGATFDATSFMMKNCEKDNSMSFTKDGKFEIKVGTDNCNEQESDLTGTWEWKSNETIIGVTTPKSTIEWKLIGLNAQTLKIGVGNIAYDINGDGLANEKVDMIFTMEGK